MQIRTDVQKDDTLDLTTYRLRAAWSACSCAIR